MMKKFTFLIAFVCSMVNVNAQIIVTNAAWPKAGDTTKLANDSESGYLLAPAQATNGNWDFSNLKEESIDLKSFAPASQGNGFADFPTAELYSKSNFADVYYNVTNSAFEILGYKGDILGFGFPLVVKGKPAAVERRNPMKYFDISNTEYTFGATFSAELLPDSLFSGIPFTPDSVRFGQNIKRLDVVDSWGKLKIPLGTYDVLREKRTSIQTIKLEVKIPVLGWTDVSNFFGGAGGTPDTSVAYHYIANGSTEPIMVLNCTATGDTIQDIDFKTNKTKVGIFSPSLSIGKLNIFPNPANHFIELNTTGIIEGKAHLMITDLLGKTMREETDILTKEPYNWFINLDNFNVGMYFVSLKDEKGNIKASGTFSIVR
ncbi:MAG TPA: T9SS type A sorting domain-containing protein [Saprospiraceae bacterium]|nr:T9SS type A sorting domain-containing protein [Saprospiraceae bacterium]